MKISSIDKMIGQAKIILKKKAVVPYDFSLLSAEELKEMIDKNTREERFNELAERARRGS